MNPKVVVSNQFKFLMIFERNLQRNGVQSFHLKLERQTRLCVKWSSKNQGEVSLSTHPNTCRSLVPQSVVAIPSAQKHQDACSSCRPRHNWIRISGGIGTSIFLRLWTLVAPKYENHCPRKQKKRRWQNPLFPGAYLGRVAKKTFRLKNGPKGSHSLGQPLYTCGNQVWGQDLLCRGHEGFWS